MESSMLNGQVPLPVVPLQETEEDLFAQAYVQCRVLLLPLAIRTAVDVGVFDILAQCCNSEGGSEKPLMTAHDVMTHIPNKNSQAADMVDRLLQLLASFDIVVCKVETDTLNKVVRKYGPKPICKWLTKDEDGVSMAPFVLWHSDPAYINAWFHMKDAILEGGEIPFDKAHGMSLYEFQGTDQASNRRFNESMKVHSSLMTKKMLDAYNGFSTVRVLVDVGGGVGETVNSIVSKYKHIQGINFDLPHVISQAPSFPGVKHVCGDMFHSVPSGDAIFLKFVIHNWSDVHCVSILKNCYKALPNNGKVIIMDMIRPEKPDSNRLTQVVLLMDLTMLSCLGGKERTNKEIEALAKEVGFSGFKSTYVFAKMSVIEITK